MQIQTHLTHALGDLNVSILKQYGNHFDSALISVHGAPFGLPNTGNSGGNAMDDNLGGLLFYETFLISCGNDINEIVDVLASVFVVGGSVVGESSTVLR